MIILSELRHGQGIGPQELPKAVTAADEPMFMVALKKVSGGCCR